LIILLFIVVSMVAYILSVILYGEKKVERVERQGGSLLLSKRLMRYGVWVLSPVVKALCRCSVTPNSVTTSSILFGFLAGSCIAVGAFGFASLFALLAGVTDVLDGMLARKIGKTDHSGIVYDSLVDRYIDFFLLAGCAVFFRDSVWGLVLSLLALHGSFMISYTTAKAEAMALEIPRGAMKRTERYVYLLVGIMLTAFPLAWPQWFGLAISPLFAIVSLIALLANWSAVVRFRSLFLKARYS
jgi:phosphatidylglycerophosphate synthase